MYLFFCVYLIINSCLWHLLSFIRNKTSFLYQWHFYKRLVVIRGLHHLTCRLSVFHYTVCLQYPAGLTSHSIRQSHNSRSTNERQVGKERFQSQQHKTVCVFPSSLKLRKPRLQRIATCYFRVKEILCIAKKNTCMRWYLGRFNKSMFWINRSHDAQQRVIGAVAMHLSVWPGFLGHDATGATRGPTASSKIVQVIVKFRIHSRRWL